MAQAATIIPFPSKKPIFEPLKIDVDKVLASYDRNRPYVGVAVKVLTLNATQLRQSVGRVQNEMTEEPVTELIGILESLSKDYIAMSEMADAAAARLTAGQQNLI